MDRRAQRLLSSRHAAIRGGQDREPAVEPLEQDVGERTFIRAAASSIARGRLSSRSQIAASWR